MFAFMRKSLKIVVMILGSLALFSILLTLTLNALITYDIIPTETHTTVTDVPPHTVF